jgi:hypothetical protein
VESVATSKRRLHGQRVRTGRESHLPGKVKRKTKEHEETKTEDETENDAPDDEVERGGRACRQKEWWKRGDVEAKLNTVNMMAWVHKECDIIEEEALTKLQEAWDSSELEQKDECIVSLNDLEGAYWMGTEIGQLWNYGFQGVTLGMDGSCKDGRMGSGCYKFGEKGEGICVRVGREDQGTSSNRPELGGVVLAMQSAACSSTMRQRGSFARHQKMGGTRRKGDVRHGTRCGYPTGNNLPANATCAGRESYLSGKSEVASWRTD